MLQFACEKCSAGYRVRDELAGKSFRCKQCGSFIAIPSRREGEPSERTGEAIEPSKEDRPEQRSGLGRPKLPTAGSQPRAQRLLRTGKRARLGTEEPEAAEATGHQAPSERFKHGGRLAHPTHAAHRHLRQPGQAAPPGSVVRSRKLLLLIAGGAPILVTATVGITLLLSGKGRQPATPGPEVAAVAGENTTDAGVPKEKTKVDARPPPPVPPEPSPKPRPAKSWKFNPISDLSGYRTATLSQYSDQYDFKPFEEWSGKEILEDKITELRELWKKEEERAEKKIQRYESNALARHSRDLKNKLGGWHPYFKNVEFKDVERLPFVYYIERPKKDDEAYYSRIADKFTPWLRELARLFVEEYTKPLKLKPSTSPLLFAFAVLPSRGGYLDLGDAVKSPGLGEISAAHYNEELRLVITYEEFPPRPGEDQERLHTILHEFVHALQHTYSSNARIPKAVWFTEGMAEYWAYGTPSSIDTLRKPEVDLQRLGTFVQVLGQSGMRDICVSNLKDLVTPESYESILQNVERRAGGHLPQDNRAIQMVQQSLGLYYIQAGLFMNFLHQGRGGKHKPALLRYTRAALGGRSGWDTFTEAFEGVDPKALEAEFYDYVAEQSKKILPAGAAPPKWIPKGW